MNFKVGQKIICIDDSAKDGDKSALVTGSIYTVAGFADGRAGIAILLEEIPPPNSFWYGFAPERFRPAVERKTDISIFTAMLTPKKQSALLNAKE